MGGFITALMIPSEVSGVLALTPKIFLIFSLLSERTLILCNHTNIINPNLISIPSGELQSIGCFAFIMVLVYPVFRQEDA